MISKIDQHNRLNLDERRDQGIVQLLKDLRDETTTLLRQEVMLAKAEIGEKAGRITRNCAYLAVGGGLAYLGLIVLAGAAVAALFVGLRALELSAELSAWLSPLVIGSILGIVGFALVQKAIHAIKSEKMAPEKTIESVKDDAHWVRERTGGTT